jgi:hypothetical protein
MKRNYILLKKKVYLNQCFLNLTLYFKIVLVEMKNAFEN